MLHPVSARAHAHAMSIFSDAEQVLATEPSCSVAATYTPHGGAPIAVRVIRGRQEEPIEFLGTATVAPGVAFRLPKAYYPTRPREFDTLLVEGVTYTAKADGRSDIEDAEWVLNMDGGAP